MDSLTTQQWLVRCGIDPDVIGIVAEIGTVRFRELIGSVAPYQSVASAGNAR
jgi:hypothetical protein